MRSRNLKIIIIVSLVTVGGFILYKTRPWVHFCMYRRYLNRKSCIKGYKEIVKNDQEKFKCCVNNLSSWNFCLPYVQNYYTSNEYGYVGPRYNDKEEIAKQDRIFDTLEESVGIKIDNVKKWIVVFSDIRGDYRYLMALLDWCLANEKNIDYIVDLGNNFGDNENGMVTFLILHDMRVHFRNKFIMLGGSTDDTNIILHGAFGKELVKNKFLKIDEKTSEIIYDDNFFAICNFFNSLPINALLTFENGNKCYLAHGGIPLYIEQTGENTFTYDLNKYFSGKRISNYGFLFGDKGKQHLVANSQLNLDKEEKGIKVREGDFYVGYLIPQNVELEFMEKNLISTIVTGSKDRNEKIKYNSYFDHVIINTGNLGTEEHWWVILPQDRTRVSFFNEDAIKKYCNY